MALLVMTYTFMNKMYVKWRRQRRAQQAWAVIGSRVQVRVEAEEEAAGGVTSGAGVTGHGADGGKGERGSEGKKGRRRSGWMRREKTEYERDKGREFRGGIVR